MANKDLHLRAATHFPALVSTATDIANVLKQASKRMYGASEGRIFIQSWTLYAGKDCNDCDGATCDLCFKDICNSCGTGGLHPLPEVLGCSTNNCTGPYSNSYRGSYVNGFVDSIANDYSASRTVVHEMGHWIGGVGDEYVSGWVFTCGHSMMGRVQEINSFCSQYNHGRDALTTFPFPLSVQQQIAINGYGPDPTLVPNGTPDEYDYADFDFGGDVGVVSVVGAAPDPIRTPWGGGLARAALGILLLSLGSWSVSRRQKGRRT